MAPFDPMGMRSDKMAEREIKNARLAMVAFVGFASQAAVQGKGPIECLKVRSALLMTLLVDCAAFALWAHLSTLPATQRCDVKCAALPAETNRDSSALQSLIADVCHSPTSYQQVVAKLTARDNLCLSVLQRCEAFSDERPPSCAHRLGEHKSALHIPGSSRHDICVSVCAGARRGPWPPPTSTPARWSLFRT